MKFKVEITETLQRQVEVEAKSMDEALKIVDRQYYDGELIMDDTDYVDVSIAPVLEV